MQSNVLPLLQSAHNRPNGLGQPRSLTARVAESSLNDSIATLHIFRREQLPQPLVALIFLSGARVVRVVPPERLDDSLDQSILVFKIQGLAVVKVEHPQAVGT